MKRLLIADDEPLIRRALADYLTAFGYATETAADGGLALDRLRGEDFDALLVDLRMPRVSGLDVIAALVVERPNLPIVVVSGTGVLGDAVEAMRLGAWDYISKPIIDMEELVVIVERVLEKARLISERDHYQQEIERLNRSLEAEVARQTHDLRVQNRRLGAMNHVAYTISHAGDLDTMLGRALSTVVGAVQADAASVHLYNPATNSLYLARTLGICAEGLPFPSPLPVGEGVVSSVILNHVAQIGATPRDVSAAGTDSVVPPGFHTYAYIPLHVTDGAAGWDEELLATASTVGVLAIFARHGEGFQPEEVELLTTVGNQLGVAVTRTRYAADLRRAFLQLEAANADLLRLDTLREQFIQNVAHELRTPLALVRGYIELLAEGELDPEQQGRALTVIRERVEALVKLVESITTLQDLTTQPLRLSAVAPVELLSTARKMMGQKAIAAGIKVRLLDADQLPPLSGDFDRLTQVLCQLLDNACKFSPSGTSVALGANLSVDGRHIVLTVRDEGIGIPEEEHERIFERFYQVDGSATRRYGGTGLGLALVKEITAAHHGWVRVESGVGVGSTFSVFLPRCEVPASS
jgi:signal transduction histidine kinase/DNA-binding response OmpR family regulator